MIRRLEETGAGEGIRTLDPTFAGAPEPVIPLHRPTISAGRTREKLDHQSFSSAARGSCSWESVVARLLTAAVLIGLTAGLIPSGAASAARLHSGDRWHWQEQGYTVEEVGPNTPAALAGVRPGDRIMAIGGRAVNSADDIDREMQRGGNSVVVHVERAGRRLLLRIAPRALTRSEAEEYVARSRRVLGIVHTERRFILRPGTGANGVYIPPPIPPDPPAPPVPMIVN